MFFDCSQENESYVILCYIVHRNPPLVTFDYLSFDEFDLEIVSNLTGKQLYELFDGVLVD